MPFNAEPVPSSEISDLQDQIKQLQMEIDVLKEALNLLKKDPGINVTELKNREKAVIIDAMKNKYPLPKLLKLVRRIMKAEKLKEPTKRTKNIVRTKVKSLLR